MRIYRIETGRVRVKKNQISRAKGMAPGMTKVLFGKEWSDWLPIYAWIIEHNEGIFAVDTGETHKTGINGYLPGWHPYYSLAVEFDVRPEQEIGPQLEQMGIRPSKDVNKVIMTHLHTDHAGGIYHFPKSEIIIDRREYRSASGFTGIMAGYLPHHWPDWLDPHLISLPEESFGPFPRSLKLTKDASIILVSTPGHVQSHISVIVIMEDVFYFIAGDSSYNQKNMLIGIPDGVGTKESVGTLDKIREFTSLHPTVYLPSHDPEAALRMDEQIIVPQFQGEHV